MAPVSNAIVAALALIEVGCQPFSRALLEEVDLQPSTLVATAAVWQRSVSLVFTEWVLAEVGSIVFEALMAVALVSDGTTVEILADSQQVGQRYRVAATVAHAARQYDLVRQVVLGLQ